MFVPFKFNVKIFSVGAGFAAQWIKLQVLVLAFHTEVLVQVPATLLPIQLAGAVAEKSAGDVPSSWILISM